MIQFYVQKWNGMEISIHSIHLFYSDGLKVSLRDEDTEARQQDT